MMNAQALSPPVITLEDALSLLSHHQYRLTGPRRLVLEAVLRCNRPFTAEQIVAETGDVGRATVYRTLEILASVDLLNRLMNVDGHPAYVLGQPGHRHHLVCSTCGGVVEFTACPMDGLIETLRHETRFRIESHHLEVSGLCPACQ